LELFAFNVSAKLQKSLTEEILSTISKFGETGWKERGSVEMHGILTGSGMVAKKANAVRHGARPVHGTMRGGEKLTGRRKESYGYQSKKLHVAASPIGKIFLICALAGDDPFSGLDSIAVKSRRKILFAPRGTDRFLGVFPLSQYWSREKSLEKSY
jgi:hypothetical protein